MEWAGLEIRWELVPSPADRIRVRAVVGNRGERHVRRELPTCVARVRLYRAGELAWDRASEDACGGIRRVDLGPGEEAEFWWSAAAAEILGDDMPAGDYLVRVYLPPGRRPGPPRAEMELTLGEITLDGS